MTHFYSISASWIVDPSSLLLSLGMWRDISLIWLSLLCFIGLVLPLALAYLAVRGMDAALRHASTGLHKAQSLSAQARVKTASMSHKVAAPVIAVNRHVSRWQRVARALGISGSTNRSTHHSGKR